MQDDEFEPETSRSDKIWDAGINLVALVFSIWFCYTFVGAPVRSFMENLLQSDQLDRPKDQQRLP